MAPGSFFIKKQKPLLAHIPRENSFVKHRDSARRRISFPLFFSLPGLFTSTASSTSEKVELYELDTSISEGRKTSGQSSVSPTSQNHKLWFNLEPFDTQNFSSSSPPSLPSHPAPCVLSSPSSSPPPPYSTPRSSTSSRRRVSMASIRSFHRALSTISDQNDNTNYSGNKNLPKFLGRHPGPSAQRSISLPVKLARQRSLQSSTSRHNGVQHPDRDLYIGGHEDKSEYASARWVKVPKFVPLEVRWRSASGRGTGCYGGRAGLGFGLDGAMDGVLEEERQEWRDMRPERTGQSSWASDRAARGTEVGAEEGLSEWSEVNVGATIGRAEGLTAKTGIEVVGKFKDVVKSCGTWRPWAEEVGRIRFMEGEWFAGRAIGR